MQNAVKVHSFRFRKYKDWFYILFLKVGYGTATFLLYDQVPFFTINFEISFIDKGWGFRMYQPWPSFKVNERPIKFA